MRKYLLAAILASLSFTPFLSLAALVPCTGPAGTGKTCDFNQLYQLVNNFINYAILIAFPIVACIFAYAGWLLITDQGSASNQKKAWEMIKDAGTGFAIMLLGWVAIKFILDQLLNSSFSGFLNTMFRANGS